MIKVEPKIHGVVEDSLHPAHPLAFKAVECDSCRDDVHSSPNECLNIWVETGIGNFCVPCFSYRLQLYQRRETDTKKWGLNEP